MVVVVVGLVVVVVEVVEVVVVVSTVVLVAASAASSPEPSLAQAADREAGAAHCQQHAADHRDSVAPRPPLR